MTIQLDAVAAVVGLIVSAMVIASPIIKMGQVQARMQAELESVREQLKWLVKMSQKE